MPLPEPISQPTRTIRELVEDHSTLLPDRRYEAVEFNLRNLRDLVDYTTDDEFDRACIVMSEAAEALFGELKTLRPQDEHSSRQKHAAALSAWKGLAEVLARSKPSTHARMLGIW